MRKLPVLAAVAIVLLPGVVPAYAADLSLEDLQLGQEIHGFKTLNLYDNSAGAAMGARFISTRYGFIIDFMQIESVPQAFFWIKTTPTSSKGEPHACEHLLLGKGNRGRYVAALENMALSSSSAYTSLIRTCYHFNTTAGEETFYDIFEAKLQAFLHPDFTDEEIRREVCHIGVTVDPETGELSIEEKGTVYTEMVSYFEKSWYHVWAPMNRMVYGENHPLTFFSFGDPAVMRSMVPRDMWSFHGETHHLANMGAVAAVPGDVRIEDFLSRMSSLLSRCQAHPDSSPLPGIGGFDFPPARPAPPGTLKLTTYPSEKSADPGYMTYAWPADLELDQNELFMLEIFLKTFAGGQTSNLYDLFINSQTCRIDLGGNSVDGGVDDDLGNSIYFELEGVDNTHINETMIDSVRSMIVSEVARIRDFADGSDELAEFNREAGSRLVQNRKQTEKYLNSPPMFGFRSLVGKEWVSLLEDLEDEEGFRKSLVMKDRYHYAESLLTLDRNIWKDYIDHWRLLTEKAYALGAAPSSEILEKEAQAREARLAQYIDEFREKYGVTDEQKAIAAYKDEFDALTAELEALASKDELPGFIDNPPMTLDDQLNYEAITLSGGVPLVASTFENMTSSNVGLALRLDVIPESFLVYVPFLPTVLTNIGVVKDGEVITYDDMDERLRREVLSLHAYFSHNWQSRRMELVLSGQGSNLEELRNVLGWMDACLYEPYLSTENLPRMMDVIDQSLTGYRNRMKRSEEAWVNIPAAAYRHQRNPLFMSANCFLTQTHHYQRLKWLLTDPGGDDDQEELVVFLDALAKFGKDAGRDELTALLTDIEKATAPSGETVTDTPALADFKADPAALSSVSRENVHEIVKELKATLSDIPEANLVADWAYLCDEIRADIMVKPETALAGIKTILRLIRRADNARMFMISSSHDRRTTLDTINGLVNKLDSGNPSVRQEYRPVDRIVERLKSRRPNVDKPLYVGLVHDGTRNGVILFSARLAGQYDTSSSAILDCLAGKLYSGGGPHGLFMNTWAAGLAYSNGYGYGQSSGRASYYAERCPDVAETMRFVVGVLEEAEDDPGLTDYAVAQVFLSSRAASRYEARGEAMAANLADGVTPDVVRTFRQKVLEVGSRDGLYEELKSRMGAAYGPVLIGYGPPLSESKEAAFFMIGPEPQFESMEKHIEQTEGKQTIYRLYPRDFWLTL
ncbi:MAG: insulinase family protein [candidate division Zixibacteria bacterium]|nr:insulinase family protein [candidate division Zixibacteria bacterium]